MFLKMCSISFFRKLIVLDIFENVWIFKAIKLELGTLFLNLLYTWTCVQNTLLTKSHNKNLMLKMFVN